MEEYVLIEQKKNGGRKIAMVLGLLVVVLSLFVALIIPGAFIFTVVLGILWYLFLFRSDIEYEYSYFEGDLRFARIVNKSRRKALQSFGMDAVLQIAPEGDRSVSTYDRRDDVKKLDYSSGVKNESVYRLAARDDKGKTYLITFEPDEKILDAICRKYKQKVIRK